MKSQFQQGAIDLLNRHPLPQLLQLEFWGKTQSDKVIPGLLQALEDSDSEWRQDIETALASVKVAVFLVSPDFLNSDFIHEKELPPLLDAAKQQGLAIVWVLLSHCLHETSKIVDYQAAHDVAQPLDSLGTSEQNKTLAEICRKIQQAVLGE